MIVFFVAFVSVIDNLVSVDCAIEEQDVPMKYRVNNAENSLFMLVMVDWVIYKRTLYVINLIF
ncbi:hypothetical protein D3C86_770480 [compost metagenome]